MIDLWGRGNAFEWDTTLFTGGSATENTNKIFLKIILCNYFYKSSSNECK